MTEPVVAPTLHVCIVKETGRFLHNRPITSEERRQVEEAMVAAGVRSEHEFYALVY